MKLLTQLRIGAAAALIALLTLVVLIFGVARLGAATSDRIAAAHLQFESAYALRADVIRHRDTLVHALSGGTGDALPTIERHLNAAYEALTHNEQVKRRDDPFRGEGDASSSMQDVGRLRELLQRLQRESGRALQQRTSGEPRPAESPELPAPLSARYIETIQLLDTMAEREWAAVRDTTDRLAVQLRAFEHAALAGLVFGSAVLVGMLFVAVHRFGVGVKLLVAGTERVQRGSFNEPLDDERDDEFGKVATAFNEMLAELRRRNDELHALSRKHAIASHRAGMAEIADGVLHNVGNVLNSIGISSEVASGTVQQSRAAHLRRAIEMLHEHKDDLGAYLSADPKGQQLFDYLQEASSFLVDHQRVLSEEIANIQKNVEHVKRIIGKQQEYARTEMSIEECQIPELLDEAIQLACPSLTEEGIELCRDYREPLPEIVIDRTRILQILTNLLSNARQAVRESKKSSMQIGLSVQLLPDRKLEFRVRDNGVGVAQSLTSKLFRHGFTTKPDGHGFGLHNSFLMAQEMGGSLEFHSLGAYRGAEFTLQVPLREIENGMFPPPSSAGYRKGRRAVTL